MFNNVDQWSIPAKFMLAAHPRGNDHGEPITHTCNVPYYDLTIDLNGDCFLCACDAWLPLAVGNILDFQNLEEVWNSPTATEIQQDVTDQKFTHCAVNLCGVANRDISRTRHAIGINIDESCNLECPTCRRHHIFHKSGDLYEKKLKQVEHAVKLINQFDKPLDIVISGNGDPLASLIMRPVLTNWAPLKNQRLKLFTNGLLIKKMLSNSAVFPAISHYQISVDAGTADVYHIVRKPGNFDSLVENLEWLCNNKKPGVNVSLMFCVSAFNVHDIYNFAMLCDRFKFIGNLTKLNNWYTLDKFEDYNVAESPEHPLYSTLIEQLTLIKDFPYIFLDNYLKKLISN